VFLSVCVTGSRLVGNGIDDARLGGGRGRARKYDITLCHCNYIQFSRVNLGIKYGLCKQSKQCIKLHVVVQHQLVGITKDTKHRT
jgi:hypothetical protein